jgi:homoserine kinase type II
LPFYLNLMSHLARHGIPCPNPVANRSNHFLGTLNGKPACIVSRLSGKSTTSPNGAQCAAVGAMLGQMHIAGQSFSQVMPNPRGAAWRAATAPQVKPFLDAQQAALLESEVALQSLQDWTSLPQGVIHADLFPDNVFFLGDRLSGLIDFYFACTDTLAYDVAICLNAWCFEADHAYNVTKGRALLKAYAKVRALSAEERAALPMLARGAAVRFLLTRLIDWLAVPDGALVKPKDPLEYYRKLRFHQSVKSVRDYGIDA